MEDAVRAVRWFTDPKNHEGAVEIAAKVIKQPPANVAYVFTKAEDYHDPDMRPNLETFQRAIDIQQGTGFLKEKLDAKIYSDLSILEDALKRIK